jgi:hypothetical protein
LGSSLLLSAQPGRLNHAHGERITIEHSRNQP